MAPRREYTTPQRARFFYIYDQANKSRSFGAICRDSRVNIPQSTARTWLKKRDELGPNAVRRTRRHSNKLGRPPQLSEATLDHLLDRNDPRHSLPYDLQAQDLPVTAKTLQQNFSKRRNARRYKKPTTKVISLANKKLRITYGREHQGKTITGFWRYVYFTDECHFNSLELSDGQEYELREPNSLDRLGNLQETYKARLNVTVHVAAGISYDGKGVFEFYNDPAEPNINGVYRPRRPRKSSVETKEQHQAAIRLWEAGSRKDIEFKLKGNSMTTEFYTKRILPLHITRIKHLEQKYRDPVYFEEDNDSSHGTRTYDNVAAQLKRTSRILQHHHPPQSPDLSPIEAIWMIIKAKLRGKEWRTVAAFKEDILAEWRQITLSQIRRRIAEMPWRCHRLIELEGGRIRSDLW